MSETESQQIEKDPVQYDTKTLFGKARIVLIEHAGQVYRLMITRQGKLILNK
jgi:hemin uptake protein HemP